MRKSIATAIITACAATSACGVSHRPEDSGPSVNRTYRVGNFHKIEVAGPYEVAVRTGGNPGVSATGSEKLLGRTVVEVQGDRLVIHPQEHRHGFSFTWNSSGNAKFTVTVPQLNTASLTGSGGLRVEKFQGDSFEGEIGGSGDLAVDSVNVKSLKLSIDGSGSAKAAGKTQSAEYEIGGSGEIDAGGVQAQQAKVSVAGSGNVKANAAGAADVSIMGSGGATVTGGAKCNVTKAGSGEAHCS